MYLHVLHLLPTHTWVHDSRHAHISLKANWANLFKENTHPGHDAHVEDAIASTTLTRSPNAHVEDTCFSSAAAEVLGLYILGPYIHYIFSERPTFFY